MGNCQSAQPPGSGLNTAPWTNLKEPTNISLLGLDHTGKSSILQHFAAYGPEPTEINILSPFEMVQLETVQHAPLTIASETTGRSAPRNWDKDVQAIQPYLDAVVFVLDHRDGQRFPAFMDQIERISSSFTKDTHAPLLILRNWYDADNLLGNVDIDGELHSSGLIKRFSTYDYWDINAETGESLLDAAESLVNDINWTRERFRIKNTP